jgi:hypothetical protein
MEDQVRVDAFNIFNAVHCANPVSNFNPGRFRQIAGVRRNPNRLPPFLGSLLT